MSKILRWIINGLIATVIIAMGYYYLTRSAQDNLSGFLEECMSTPQDAGSAEAVSVLVNDILNRNGVADMVTSRNLRCVGNLKTAGSRLVVFIDPSRDLLANYQKFIDGQTGTFAFAEKIKADAADIKRLQLIKAPFNPGDSLAEAGELNVYRKYLKDSSSGRIDLIVPAHGEKPFVIITREAGW